MIMKIMDILFRPSPHAIKKLDHRRREIIHEWLNSIDNVEYIKGGKLLDLTVVESLVSNNYWKILKSLEIIELLQRQGHLKVKDKYVFLSKGVNELKIRNATDKLFESAYFKKLYDEILCDIDWTYPDDPRMKEI